MPPKRKRSSVATSSDTRTVRETTIFPPGSAIKPAPTKRQASRRGKIDTNPDHNAEIMDGKAALRASPDADEKGEALAIEKVIAAPATLAKSNGHSRQEDSNSASSDLSSEPSPAKKPKKTPTKSSIAAKKGLEEIKAFKAEKATKKTLVKKEVEEDEWDKRLDPDGDGFGPVEDVNMMKKEAARPPPVNSDYLPLPWKGRLGYVS
jgi:UV DNA damage endonuclease